MSFLLMILAASTSLPAHPQAASSAQAPPTVSTVVTEEDVLHLAARMVSASSVLEKIWPGYWPGEQAFVINLPERGAFLVASGERPAGWEPVPPERLPEALRGRTYFRAGPIEGASRPFITNFPLGDGRTAIFVNAQEDATKVAGLLLHEQFHVFQRKAFKFKRERQFVSPTAIADRVSFAAMAELERRILAAALAAPPAEQRRLLRTYFAARRERQNGLNAEVREVEQNFERSEGTAQYVDRMAHAAIFGGDVERMLIEDLQKALVDRSGPFATIWFRGRSYSTGAALTYLLSRYQPTAWREQIEAGGDPAALLEALIAPHPEPEEAVRAARARFGYEELVRQMRPVIEAGARAEIKSEADFLALGTYAVTIELPPEGGSQPPMRPTFSARDMAFLTPSTFALREADSFTMGGGGTEIVVRGRPVLADSRADRVVVLLDGAPPLGGAEGPAAGELRLDSLRIEHQGLTLRHDGPVIVKVEAGRMSIRLLPAG